MQLMFITMELLLVLRFADKYIYIYIYIFYSVLFVQLFKLGPLQFICVSENSDSVKQVRGRLSFFV